MRAPLPIEDIVPQSPTSYNLFTVVKEPMWKEEWEKKRLKAAKVLIISITMGIGHKVNIVRTCNCYPDSWSHPKICGYKSQKAICDEKEKQTSKQR